MQSRHRLLHLAIAAALVTTAIGLVAPAASGDTFAGHGWFWYQMPPPPKKVILPPAPPPSKPKPAVKPLLPKVAPPMSVAWIKKYRHEYMVRAINNPTAKNVAEFMYLNDAMFDKAQNFAEMFGEEAQFNTALNPSFTVPTSQAGIDAFYKRLDASKKRTDHWLAKHTGIFFFFSSNCPYCKLQYQQLEMFLQTMPKYKKHVYYISMDGRALPGMTGVHVYKNTGQAKFFHLVETPALVLAVPPKTFIVIGQGEVVDAEIHQRLLAAALRFRIVPKNLRESINPYDRGVISTKQFQDMAKQKINPNNPSQVGKLLDKDINKRLYNW